ncbi:polysaccharide deacetylase family protein [Ferruginibacter sp.]
MKNCFLVLALIGLLSCNNTNEKTTAAATPDVKQQIDTAATPIADAATILSRTQVPILCYHHIQNTRISEYMVLPAKFTEQMQAFADSGYQTILPDQLYNYLAYGKPLPPKPFMITFDDTDAEQFTIGYTEMKKHNFKGVFFIMNISIGRKRYMSKEQLKQLSDEGHVIAGHTWDHHMVTKYNDSDWNIQLTEAKQKLQSITGKPVDYFAYPFGLWNAAAIPALQQRNIKMAFQLSTKQDSTQPLYTVRRMIVPGTWSTPGLFKAMKKTFGL